MRRPFTPLKRGVNVSGDLEALSGGIRTLRPKQIWNSLELGLLSLVLVLVNWPLVRGVCNSSMIFLPSAVAHGEWWRILTHSFVHVTWFHLLLDGAAFFLLYRDLQEQAWGRRFAFLFASGAGSLLVPLWADPLVAEKGLCGLSGIAHGLMAVSALDLMFQRRDKIASRVGMICFALLFLKCLIEALTGKMLFTFLYFGLVGDPVAVTHAGGFLGGAAAWGAIKTIGQERGRLVRVLGTAPDSRGRGVRAPDRMAGDRQV